MICHINLKTHLFTYRFCLPMLDTSLETIIESCVSIEDNDNNQQENNQIKEFIQGLIHQDNYIQ
jgi:hypothetical protein